MKRAFLAALMFLAACERRGNEQTEAAPDTAALADTASAPAASPADSARPMNPGTKFDATQVKVGDRVAGLEVASSTLQPAPGSPMRVSGGVRFKGELELKGAYRAHYEYPEVKEPCFWVDPGEWPKVPRAQNDQRIIWLCFTNQQQAIAQLGPLGSNVRATIVIDDYTTNLVESDVWDQARLVRVVNKEKMP